MVWCSGKHACSFEQEGIGSIPFYHEQEENLLKFIFMKKQCKLDGKHSQREYRLLEGTAGLKPTIVPIGERPIAQLILYAPAAQQV